MLVASNIRQSNLALSQPKPSGIQGIWSKHLLRFSKQKTHKL